MRNSERFLYFSFIVSTLLCFLLLSEPAVGSLVPKTLDRDADPFIVTGDNMPEFIGTPLSRLFVYAYVGSQWQQIPWQFDEIKDKLYMALDNGELDPVDELVVMGQDCGDRTATSNWISDVSAQSDLRYEIRVIDPLNTAKRCWVYVYRSINLTETVTEDYVDYVPDSSLFTSPVYKLGWFLEYFAGKTLRLNGSNVNLLDRSKLRIAWGLWGNENEEFLEGEEGRPEILDGRIRAIAGYQGVVEGFDLRLLTIAYRSQFYDRLAFDFSWAAVPLEAVRLSADFNQNVVGSTYYDANNPLGVTVDGVPETVAATPVSLWQQLSGSTGTIFHAGDASRIPGVQSTYYKDDASIDPDDTGDKKSYGDMGMTITGPFYFIDAEITHYILPPNQPNMGAKYYGYYTHPLTITAIEQTLTATQALEVTRTGGGTVTSAPAGIDCGSNCMADFDEDANVSLAAELDPAWTLGRWVWSGACTGSGACNIVMDEDKLVMVKFYCLLQIIPGQTVDSAAPAWSCFDLEATGGFEVLGPNGEVIFSAKNSILLGPGFLVEKGATFRALIESGD